MPTDPPVTGRRAANRIERTRRFLHTALDIVTTEGFDALTMQRLADECDAAIGAVYRYFPSKGALVAEVQREAIESLATSAEIVRSRCDRALAASGTDPQLASMVRLVVFGRWFVGLVETHPQELRLLQMLMSEWRPVVPVDEGMRVVPTAMRLLDRARATVEEAATLGVIDDRSDPMSRVVVWAAALGGVVQTGRLDVYDAELFDGLRLGWDLCVDLFRGWGAPAELIDAAEDVVDPAWFIP